MERDQRHFNRKPKEYSEAKKQSDLFRSEPVPVRNCTECGNQLPAPRHHRKIHEVEFPCAQKDGEKGQQQCNASNHGVEKEHGRRRCTLRSAPEANQEKCRDKAELPEQKPVKEVEGCKGSEQPCFKHQNQREVK